jgi:hypothetical protein
LRSPDTTTTTTIPGKAPDWLPAPVRSHALLAYKLFAGMPAEFHAEMPEFAILHRLTTDSRMRYVWKELHRHKPHDTALVEFFDSAFQGARLPYFVTTPQDRAALAKPWSTAAKLCRAAKEISIPARLQPELAAALDVAAGILEAIEQREGNLDSPMIVKQRGKDDIGRAYVRMLSSETRRLFNSPLFGTIAKTATVALDRPITWQQVRNWTKSLPANPC